MKVKNIKNGVVVTIPTKTAYIDGEGKKSTLEIGQYTIENAEYIIVNATDAGQEEMDIKDWIVSHPHCWAIKDTDAFMQKTDGWIKTVNKKYPNLREKVKPVAI